MSVTAMPLILSKYASNSATPEYIAPSSTNTIIDKFTATNVTGGAVTLTIYVVPNSGSPSASNTILPALSIAANTAVEIDVLKNHIISTGSTIQVMAGASSSIVIRMSGREVR
jgi:hypothetical protein